LASIEIFIRPTCPYCMAAKRLLTTKGHSWNEVDISAEPERRGEMVERSGRTTVPQIWIGERHVGGFDDLAALDEAGELDPLLA
jgi:glutaredoxin 3